MKIISKMAIPDRLAFSAMIPVDSKVIHSGVQDGVGVNGKRGKLAVVWMEHDAGKSVMQMKRDFCVVPPGQPVPDNFMHFVTVQLDGSHTIHVYEVPYSITPTNVEPVSGGVSP